MHLNLIDITDAERMMAAQAWLGLVVSFLVGGLYWPILLAWKPKDAPMTEHDPTRRLWRAILVDQAGRLTPPPVEDAAADESLEDELDRLELPVG